MKSSFLVHFIAHKSGIPHLQIMVVDWEFGLNKHFWPSVWKEGVLPWLVKLVDRMGEGDTKRKTSLMR